MKEVMSKRPIYLPRLAVAHISPLSLKISRLAPHSQSVVIGLKTSLI
jgi:hypothetical protein